MEAIRPSLRLQPVLASAVLLAACSSASTSVDDVEQTYGVLPETMTDVLADSGVDATCRDVALPQLAVDIDPAVDDPSTRGWVDTMSTDEQDSGGMQFVVSVLCDVETVGPDADGTELHAAVLDALRSEGFADPQEADGRGAAELRLPPTLVPEDAEGDLVEASTRWSVVLLPEFAPTVEPGTTLSLTAASPTLPQAQVRDDGTVFVGE